MDEIDRRLRRKAEISGALPEGDTPGERFVSSLLYQDIVGTHPGTSGSVRVATFSEVFAATPVGALWPAYNLRDPRVFARHDPAPARVPSLVEVIPVEGTFVRTAYEDSRTVDAGGVPIDAPTHESVINFVEGETELYPWGSHANVPRRALRDPGIAQSVVERVLREITIRELEKDMLSGDGSETATTRRLTGILSTTGIGAVAKGAGETIAAAIARGAAVVQSAGHYLGTIAAVAHPDDLVAMFTETDAGGNWVPWRDILEAVDELIPSTKMTAGTALVGAFFGGATLYHEGGENAGWGLDLSGEHSTNFTEGRITMQVVNHLRFDVHTPAAFCQVTAL